MKYLKCLFYNRDSHNCFHGCISREKNFDQFLKRDLEKFKDQLIVENEKTKLKF